MILVNFEPKRPAGDVFRGRPAASGKKAVVTVNGKPLPLRLDLWKISPSGFNWGYGGAGPGQLALAVLAHAAGDEVARAEWDRFRHGFIKKLDIRQTVAFTASDVTAFLNGLPVDARQFIRPVRKQEKKGWRNFWKRLLEKAA